MNIYWSEAQIWENLRNICLKAFDHALFFSNSKLYIILTLKQLQREVSISIHIVELFVYYYFGKPTE